ncbi:aceric acid hydrolase [Arcticibacter tournemirensis]|uniref:aceric acid hydrolase n=1 Tax=Arcticibacter tournemirensis TaxID=699437 RepID=UPI001F284A1B|nr:glycoside hydrolase family 127 protein [Arcticibacter tournemirensis]
MNRIMRDKLKTAFMLAALSAGVMVLTANRSFSQDKSLVNTTSSPYAKLKNVNMGAVKLTSGFWAERLKVCQDSMIPYMWNLYKDPEVAHAFRNFEIAAGLKEGKHSGPPFHDGDFYKLIEALSAMYAITKDPKLDRYMDEVIPVIAKCQRADGYIHTPTIIEERNAKGKAAAFKDRLHFETYNMGHLMTAACVHYRATGKTSLLNIAKKATDYLYNFHKKSSPELARNAICPSHYMGVVEMYRTTRDPRYLELSKSLIDIRGLVENGTDDNQDRIPFRKQTKAMGHAVRANYLYAGVADVYAETGDTSLLKRLNLMWDDVTQHKMYITGACGALYDGVSPDGTSYEPTDVQKVHQAYGRDYQLPNFTAHGETCANIGNMLWNWRMLTMSGDAKYADIAELTLYNSILSGISLNGTKFLYTNPLSYSDELPFKQRWSKDRVGYIALSNCCPPNVVRTIAEVNNYLYSVSDKGLWVNLYGGSKLSTKLRDGSVIKLTQETAYPWDGNIRVSFESAPSKPFDVMLRIPGWCKGASLKINGKDQQDELTAGTYATITRKWAKGDIIELILPMNATLVESNPLVEETRNQVAVKRGPVVYCLEAKDLPQNVNMFDVAIPLNAVFTPKALTVSNSHLIALEGEGFVTGKKDWNNKLYREMSQDKPERVKIRLVPYYAWGNRGHTDMEVWMPVR